MPLTFRTAALAVLALVLAPAGVIDAETAGPAAATHLALTAGVAPADAADGAHEGAPASAVTASTGTYHLPVDGAVLRLFDPPAVRWGRGHRGVDIAGPDHGEVRSPGDGVVTFSGRVVDRGVVTVTHPDGLRSSLEPVEDPPPVGTAVVAGDPLGQVAASSHCRGQACVHWGVRSGDTYLDPLSLLGDAVVVLLP